jgi:hypothetical protein
MGDRPEPDVFGSVRICLSELRLGRGRNGAVCGDLPAQGSMSPMPMPAG